MADIARELKDLILTYGSDTKRALKEHPNPEYLYALSDMREDVLEWYEFKEHASLLEVGSDYGALTGLYSRRVSRVTVLDEDVENLSINALRYKDRGNIRYVTGSLHNSSGELDKDGYDYVVMIGSLKEPYGKEIAAAKSCLKPGGKLIVAVCNRLGLKYQAGAKPDGTRLSKEELTELMLERTNPSGGHLEFYYPMPDYRLAMTVYSDGYLPAKGDLTHAILAYGYPKYIRFDLGRMYDEVCEARQFETFANSFLVIWSDHEEH